MIQDKEAAIRRLTQTADKLAAAEQQRHDGGTRIGDIESAQVGVEPASRPNRDGRPPLEDRASLLRRLTAAAAENKELLQRLDESREECRAARETVEQVLQLQASSERSSMRQVGGLLRAVQALAARVQQPAAAATGEHAAASGDGEAEGDGSVLDRSRATGAVQAELGQARGDAEWSVEQSLQRLVMSMGEQIREKVALIGRLEAGQGREGHDTSGAAASPSRHAQMAAVRQLQAQLGELRQRRDEVKREMVEAERRLSALRRQEGAAAAVAQQQQPRQAPRSSQLPAGPSIKIKDPLRQGPGVHSSVVSECDGSSTNRSVSRPGLSPHPADPVLGNSTRALTTLAVAGRDRQDKELQAARQRLVEQQSRHALETDRLRRLLSEARARLQRLEASADAGAANADADAADDVEETGLARAPAVELEGELRAVEAQCAELAARLAEAEQGSAAMRRELEAGRRRFAAQSSPLAMS